MHAFYFYLRVAHCTLRGPTNVTTDDHTLGISPYLVGTTLEAIFFRCSSNGRATPTYIVGNPRAAGLFRVVASFPDRLEGGKRLGMRPGCYTLSHRTGPSVSYTHTQPPDAIRYESGNIMMHHPGSAANITALRKAWS